MVKMGGLSLKQKPIKLVVTLFLALIVSASITFPLKVSAQNDGYYDKSYAWNYKGQYWTWNLSIPVDLYDAYVNGFPFITNSRWARRLRLLHHN